MLITCPNCEAGYEVPDHLLAGEGRRLRCKGCTEEWHAKLPAEPDADEPLAAGPEAESEASPSRESDSVAAEAEVPIPISARQGSPRRSRLPWLAPAAAWAASLFILASGGAATHHWRADITAAWPPSERVLHSHSSPRTPAALQ